MAHQSQRGSAALAGALLLAALGAAASLLISAAALDRLPHLTDEIAYAFQGRVIAAGRVCLAPPALPELFSQENIVLTAERWCAKYPPAWPALLALGWLAGGPWLVAPSLLGLAILGIFVLGRELYDSGTGLLAAGLLAASPFALLMGASFMAHVPELWAALWCMAVLARARTSGSWRTTVLAGCLGGCAFAIRPGTAVALLTPAVAWFLWPARRRPWRRLLSLAIGFMPWLLALGVYNALAFGGGLRFGYALVEPDRYGSLGAVLTSPGVALGQRLPWYVRNLNRSLWGWPWGDLLILVPLVWPRRDRRGEGMLLACAASNVVAHSFYFYGDLIFSGPRFAFESLGPLAVLAARSLCTLHELLHLALRRVRRMTPALLRTLRTAIAAAALGALLYFPLGLRLPALVERYSQWFWGQSAEPLRAVERAGVGHSALVFVTGSPYTFGSLLLEDLPDPGQAGRLFVRDVPGLRAAALAAYPRPEVWLLKIELEPIPPDFARPLEVSCQRLR